MLHAVKHSSPPPTPGPVNTNQTQIHKHVSARAGEVDGSCTGLSQEFHLMSPFAAPHAAHLIVLNRRSVGGWGRRSRWASGDAIRICVIQAQARDNDNDSGHLPSPTTTRGPNQSAKEGFISKFCQREQYSTGACWVRMTAPPFPSARGV